MEMINKFGNGRTSILLVDDDATFRKATRTALEARGLHVLDASNGKEATAILDKNNVQLVLSDVEMPEMHGIDLLKYMKTNWPHIPVMLMTGLKDTVAVRDAFDIGAEGFLSKPFTTTELEKNIADILGEQSKVDSNKAPEGYCLVPIDDFFKGNATKLPIYLKLSEKKIVKVANKGEDLSFHMVDRFKKKGISFLYVKKEDVKQFLRTNTLVSNEVGNAPGISADRKAKVYAQSLKYILKFSGESSIDEEIVDIVKLNLDMVIELFTQDEEAFSVFENMTKHPDDVYEHSINICMVATLIAKTLGWSSPDKLQLLSCAALLHDIGLLEVTQDLWHKPHKEMTNSEKFEYETHPIRGAAVIQRLSNVPEGLDQIILQHHESADSSGFPYGIGKSKIHAVARIINLADAFCHEWDGMIKPSARKAYSRLLENMHQYDGDFLLALNKAINKEYRLS
tara:strand:+ start:25709 stop:27070 length:1362 start_codon:yes stop_codon:yes gene_type:complete